MTPSTQKKKVVILASSIAMFNLPALLIVQHLHESRWLSAFVVTYATCMTLLFAYVVSQLVKLKRSRATSQRRQSGL